MANTSRLFAAPNTRRLGAFTLNGVKQWTPSLALWGVGAGTAALFILSVTPKIKRTLLVKIPVVNAYFIDTTPDSDKPF
ncbi:hypothetical protein PENSPDRAFT_646817 [Peniophora sp. CONT]|nr:hypothetical protein PENSPDRAFT_646817 [Peniophora sp. CONT]